MSLIDVMSVRAIIAHYDLGPNPQVDLDGAQGQSNTVIRVRTDTGRYIVKLHRGYATDEQLRAECRLLDWLDTQALPFATPRFLRDRAGAWSTTVAGFPITVQPHLPGIALDPHATIQMHAAGAALGVLHHALAQFETSEDMTGFVNRLVPVRTRDWSKLECVTLPVDALTWLISASDHTDETLAHYARTLPVQLIHGDLVPNNALWFDDRLSAVLDFEFVTRQIRSLDLAMTLLFALRYWTTQDVAGIVRAFIEGYRSAVEVRPDEVAAIPQLMRLQNIASAVWWVNLALDRQIARKDIDLRIARTRDADQWLERNVDMLISALDIPGS